MNMRHDKSAVFQINDRGVVRLICVREITFADAAGLETALRNSFGADHVTFLGRFDGVEVVSGLSEFLHMALNPPQGPRVLAPVVPGDIRGLSGSRDHSQS